MPNFSMGVQRISPRAPGTVISRVNGITTVELDGGGTVTFHPSAWKGYSGAVDEDRLPPIGTRVEVFGGSSREQAEAVWRAEQ